MSCVWTNKVNCTESCDSTLPASIMLPGAWNFVEGYADGINWDYNRINLLNHSINTHISNMLDLHGSVTIVVYWYFDELSPSEAVACLELPSYIVWPGYSSIGDPNLDIETSGATANFNHLQLWMTFRKSYPAPSFFNSLELVFSSGNFDYPQYGGGIIDIKLYAGNYTPIDFGADPSPNIPIGLIEYSGSNSIHRCIFYLRNPPH